MQLAEERYIYDPLHYLVVSVTLPLAGQVIDASPDAPSASGWISTLRKSPN